jgi:hypothetical protein
MAVSVTTEPDERSMPSEPLMMTSVCPAAITPRNTDRRRIFVACALATSISLPYPFGNKPDNRNRTTARMSAATGGEMEIRFMISSFESS